MAAGLPGPRLANGASPPNRGREMRRCALGSGQERRRALSDLTGTQGMVVPRRRPCDRGSPHVGPGRRGGRQRSLTRDSPEFRGETTGDAGTIHPRRFERERTTEVRERHGGVDGLGDARLGASEASGAGPPSCASARDEHPGADHRLIDWQNHHSFDNQPDDDPRDRHDYDAH
jgi:hypothetical protein